MPVASDAALIRVEVGNTEWLLTYSTPSARSLASVGVSAGSMLSGLSPSMTKMAMSRAGCTCACPAQLTARAASAPTASFTEGDVVMAILGPKLLVRTRATRLLWTGGRDCGASGRMFDAFMTRNPWTITRPHGYNRSR